MKTVKTLTWVMSHPHERAVRVSVRTDVHETDGTRVASSHQDLLLDDPAIYAAAEHLETLCAAQTGSVLPELELLPEPPASAVLDAETAPVSEGPQ